MARAEGFSDIAVVLAALVLIAYEQTDRRTGGLTLINAGEDLHRVRLTPLSHMP